MNFIVLLVFVVLIAVLYLNLINDCSHRFPMKIGVFEVMLSGGSYCFL